VLAILFLFLVHREVSHGPEGGPHAGIAGGDPITASTGD
jgi:hypothetical protein